MIISIFWKMLTLGTLTSIAWTKVTPFPIAYIGIAVQICCYTLGWKWDKMETKQ